MLPGLARPPITVTLPAAGQGRAGGWQASRSGRPVILAAIPDAGEPAPLTVLGVVQDVWPPRVLVSVTGLASYGATAVDLYRVQAGARTLVRGGDAVVVPTGEDAVVRTDAEQPFGVPISYLAVVTIGGVQVEIPGNTLTVTLPGGKVALSDAITGQASELVITAWPEQAAGRQQTTFVVGGRAVVVGSQRGPTTGVMDVMTESDAAREQLVQLLAGATSGVLQLRQAGGYGGVDQYMAVTKDTMRRWSQDGTDPRRITALEHTVTEAWPATFLAAGYSLADVAAAYPSPPETLATLSADFPSLLSIALADFGV